MDSVPIKSIIMDRMPKKIILESFKIYNSLHLINNIKILLIIKYKLI